MKTLLREKILETTFLEKLTIGLDDKQADDYFENDCKCGL